MEGLQDLEMPWHTTIDVDLPVHGDVWQDSAVLKEIGMFSHGNALQAHAHYVYRDSNFKVQI